MKKLLILALIVFCVGSVLARPGQNTTGFIAINASQVDGSYYQVYVEQMEIGFPQRMYWISNIEWPAPSNVTVAIGVWLQGLPTGAPDFYLYEEGVEVYVNQTTWVIFHNP